MIDQNVLDRPLKIAIVHTADQGGGAELSAVSLLKALKKLGHEPHLYVGSKRTESNDITEIKRFRTFPGLLRGLKILEDQLGWQYLYHPWFRQLDQLIGSDVDIVHFQSLWSGQFGYADMGGLPRLTKLYPSLMTIRDFWALTGHCACPALSCERWKTGCGRCPDLSIAPAISADGTRFNWARKRRNIQKSELMVTAVSDWLNEQISESPIYAGKEIQTVHNGIDTEAFYPRDRQQMRLQLGLPQDAFIVMIAGQSIEGTSGKGTGAAEYAVQALRHSEVNPHVLAVGKSSARFVNEWQGPSTQVDFMTDPSQLAEHYCAADVVLVASIWETFGRIPAEAQMCGIPVVAFSTGGIPEIVEHEQTGLIAERLNPEQLGLALRRIYQDAEIRSRCESNSAQRAASMFNNELIAQRYVDLYRREITRRQTLKI